MNKGTIVKYWHAKEGKEMQGIYERMDILPTAKGNREYALVRTQYEGMKDTVLVAVLPRILKDICA